MKKYLQFILILLVSSNAIAQTDLGNYFEEYRKTQKTDIKIEHLLLNQNSLRKIVNQLEPYYSDSVTSIRRKAYYLTYKKAIIEPDKNQLPAINKLVNACSDKNSSIIKQNMGYLKQFPAEAFNSRAKDEIKKLLLIPKYEQFSDIFLIAGFLNVGQEPIKKLLFSNDSSKKLKWVLQLALARMGDEKALANIMKTANGFSTNDKVVAFLVPDLIYTRQKTALDYCINIIQNKEENCSSANAESSAKVVCGYRVMELIAPVILNFPFKIDASGTLSTNNYEKALEETRTWFNQNTAYEIKKNTY